MYTETNKTGKNLTPPAKATTEAPIAAHDATARFHRGAVPDWIEPVEIPSHGVIEGSTNWMLIDDQLNLLGHVPERFTRLAKRANNITGVDGLSEIRIVFNPSYETLILHHMKLRRGSETLDGLEDADIDFMRVEQDMYARVYSGHYQVVVQIRGLETDDSLEFAYTIAGKNPALGTHVNFFFFHTFEEPLARAFFRALYREGSRVELRHLGPKIKISRTIKNGIVEARFDDFDKPRHEFEYWVPAEYDQQVSMTLATTFTSWSDVARWAGELYDPSDDAGAIAALTEQFLAQSDQPPELAAINYVQERIRYVATNFGDGGYRPRPIATILQRRYGDCKDKTLLLCAILRQLGHQADIVLVDTDAPRGPLAALPSPSAFNHVILRAEIHGETHWIDATSTGQRGPLIKRWRHHDTAVLLVREETEELAVIPALDIATGSSSEDTIDLSGGAGTSVTIESITQISGLDAESMRRSIATNGIANLERFFEDSTSQEQGEVISELFEVSDDHEANTIRIKMRLRLIDPWRADPGGTFVFRYTMCYATELVPTLPTRGRKLPLNLFEHPTHHVHRITVLMPKSMRAIGLENYQQRRQNAGFKFSRKQTCSKNRLTVDVETQTLAAYLPAHEALPAMRDQTALQSAHLLTLEFRPKRLRWWPRFKR